jgi:hypothetical protein
MFLSEISEGGEIKSLYYQCLALPHGRGAATMAIRFLSNSVPEANPPPWEND